MLQTVQLQLAKAQGVEAHRRSLRAIVRRLRFQRRVRRMADASGGLFSEFDRGTFLLSKQLMYFERYGRLFLADVPLLEGPGVLQGAARARRPYSRRSPRRRKRFGVARHAPIE